MSITASARVNGGDAFAALRFFVKKSPMLSLCISYESTQCREHSLCFFVPYSVPLICVLQYLSTQLSYFDMIPRRQNSARSLRQKNKSFSYLRRIFRLFFCTLGDTRWRFWLGGSWGWQLRRRPGQHNGFWLVIVQQVASHDVPNHVVWMFTVLSRRLVEFTGEKFVTILKLTWLFITALLNCAARKKPHGPLYILGD